MKELLGNGQIRRKKEYEFSVVVCCAGDVSALKDTLQRVTRALSTSGVQGEIIVVDDGTIAEASTLTAKLGAVNAVSGSRGFGDCIIAGASVARGKYIIAAVADGRYDFMELSKFVDKLKGGYDLVLGCRMPSGDGNIRPEAMSFTRRRIVNPLCSFIMKAWFGQILHDPCSRMFGTTRDHFKRVSLHATGSELTTELVVKSLLSGARIIEVPITLHQVSDGAVHSEIGSLKHGGSTLMIYLAAAPLEWQAGPGLVLVAAGLSGVISVLAGQSCFDGNLNLNFLVLSVCVLLSGWQLMLSCIMLRLAATRKGIILVQERAEKLFGWIDGTPGLLLGTTMLVAGIIIAVYAHAGNQSFIGSDYSDALKLFVSGITLVVMGGQTLLSVMVLKLMGIKSR